ncbi:hypothetical protein B0I37DRAFT_420295 [Chaetomium sp. MPI-CAGE-AT-0009]|nr:hypothetical protein B0I37DRAFT_420295 [Chaetomium sp. MPI-CAGE-AT-0009]
MMESIQLAQMLADLSDLNAAESQAAVALVNANKSLPTSSADSARQSEQLPTRQGLRHHKRSASGGSAASGGSSFMSRTASPAKFDKYGRRILTPPNTRTNSCYGSIPGTPRRDTEVSRKSPFTTTTITTYPRNTPIPATHSLSLSLSFLSTAPSHGHVLNETRNQQIDDDVDRANSLMALYEIRAKLKDQDNNRNLSKLREKIAALHVKQTQGEKRDGDSGRARFSYPKSP